MIGFLLTNYRRQRLGISTGTLLREDWESSRQTAKKDIKQAEAHYQRAALHLATLQAEQRHAKKALHKKDAYVQQLGDDVNEVRSADDETLTRLGTAQARLAAIHQMWQAKLDRQEAAQAQKNCEKLESQIRDLEMHRDVLADSRRATTDKTAMSAVKAQAEDWAGILDGVASPALHHSNPSHVSVVLKPRDMTSILLKVRLCG
ncbi:unnamed protein product [Fusarium graminearum]|nr:unnamed protein product [Fusarium graminearum]